MTILTDPDSNPPAIPKNHSPFTLTADKASMTISHVELVGCATPDMNAYLMSVFALVHDLHQRIIALEIEVERLKLQRADSVDGTTD